MALAIASAYIVTLIFVLASFILLCLMCHLIYISMTKCKTSEAKKDGMFFIIVTLIGITSFYLSISFIIAVMIQIILIDGHKLHPESNRFHKAYYSLFEEMEYMIAIFDSFGHLCMMIIFIQRFQISFQESMFAYPQILMRSLNVILILLILSSLIIIIEIIRNDHNIYVIIISEIIWELAIEFMCLWLLYLFVSRMYNLVKMSASKPDSILFEIGANVSPTIATLPSRSSSLHATPKKVKSVKPTVDVMNIDDKLTVIHRPRLSLRPSSNSVNSQVTPFVTDIVKIMNKLTLLVIISVFSSILSLIGNVFIEIHELETIERHTIDTQSMWAFLLPVLDMIITSFMLYLQFKWTQNVYSKMCNRVDIMFLKLCLKITIYLSEKNNADNLQQHIKNTKDSKTSTVSSQETSQSPVTSTVTTLTLTISHSAPTLSVVSSIN